MYSSAPSKLKLSRNTTFYLPLVIFTFVGVFLVTVPMIVLLLFILYKYSIEDTIFSQALDSLILTVLITILSLVEAIIMAHTIGKESKPRISLSNLSPERTFDSKPMSAEIDTTRSYKKKRSNFNNTTQE